MKIETYLKNHHKKDLLRFVVIGSVDDGKSTLIGRLLYELKGVYKDQIESVKKATKNKASFQEEIDFSLITDGLKSEREQGITIDVAYRYFTTEKRKFIIADTPGHLQYTRNMATGSSSATTAIILIDALKGVSTQSKRHAYITSLLGIRHLVVAINKMDLIKYDKNKFNKIQKQFVTFCNNLSFEEVNFYPISALKGDNIVSKSQVMTWFKKGTILEYLETVNCDDKSNKKEFYFPVQYTLRPDQTFRGYGGSILSGEVKIGNKVVILPSGKKNQVKEIFIYDQILKKATAPLSTVITLKEEVDISRGDVMVKEKNSFHLLYSLKAELIWMSEEPLQINKSYWVKHTNSTVSGIIDQVIYKKNMKNLSDIKASHLALNDIGKVSLHLDLPITVSKYKENKHAGCFIIIDRLTNETLGAGMICDFKESDQDIQAISEGVTSLERANRFHQKPFLILFTGIAGSAKIVVARALERYLFDRGRFLYVLQPKKDFPMTKNPSQKDLILFIQKVKLLFDLGCFVFSTYPFNKKEDRKDIKLHLAKKTTLEIHLDVSVENAKQRLINLGRNPKEAEIKIELPKQADHIINANELDLKKEITKIVSILNKRKLID